MKKYVIAILLLGLFAYSANAQIIRIGLRGGINSTNINADDIFDLGSTTVAEIKSGDYDLGYHIGLTSRIKIAGIFLQPELLYTTINSSMEVKQPDGTVTEEDINIQRIDVPILLGLKLGPLKGFVGPVFSSQIETKPEDGQMVFNSGTWGYQAGLGVEIGKFGIDLRYEGSINSPTDSYTIGGQTFELDSRVSQIILTGSYWF